ncbi:MAG: type II secretion system protein [Deltaproteobacteria bacterium]|nr:type II secretion system protein [Deltaproteobacteria bacterium]MBI5809899.1 type II secretion system protein [Deltaproteobacteria bacterium]
MLKNKKGFTLIELVMVIVILAILAAVAVPRFIDLKSDAQISTAKGIGGAIAGAANIMHAQWLLKSTVYQLGDTSAPTDTGILYNANISGATVTANVTTPTVDGTTATIYINVSGNTYTLTYTAGSTTRGPRIDYGF